MGGLDGAGLSEVLNFSDTVNPDFTVYGSEVLFDGLDSSNNATLWKTDGTAAGTSEISSQAIAPEDMTLFTSGAQLAVTSVLQNPTSGSSADLKAGGTVLITLVMTEDAIVSGTPKLEFNISGGSASYVSGSGTPDLTFKYTVASGQNIPDLEVTSTSLVGATITNAGGFSADLSRVSGTDLGIKIDTAAPAVNSVSATPASGTTLKLGGTAKIDLDLSEAVIVSGSPTLKLSDGGTAVYNPAASTPATGVLEFDYTVTSHQSSSDLTIVSASLAGGASIANSAGNAANLALTAAEKNLNLGVNGIPPIVTAVTAVASPPGTDVISGGTVAITLKLSEAVTVSGTPILELSDGGSAHYVSSVTASSLVFDYNVGSEFDDGSQDYRRQWRYCGFRRQRSLLKPDFRSQARSERVHLYSHDERRRHLELINELDPTGSPGSGQHGADYQDRDLYGQLHPRQFGCRHRHRRGRHAGGGRRHRLRRDRRYWHRDQRRKD